ncbi:MAG TPA: hypothetical protein VM580_13130 [Labilithrix sp.]|nr:hypothetical protein [Labilithrix sp.]
MRMNWRTVGTMTVLGSGIGLGCGGASEEAPSSVPQEETVETVETMEQAYLAAPAQQHVGESLLDAWPSELPGYFKESYAAVMAVPLPKVIAKQQTPIFVNQLEIHRDPTGYIGSFQPSGITLTSQNAFFQPLGRNGRTCFTCHQMDSSMGVSLRNIHKRFITTLGADPIFAAVDGANCPNQVASKPSKHLFSWLSPIINFLKSHSLLLGKGLIRIPIPVPANADFTIEVVSDPTTCNLDPEFNRNANGVRIVSVFRRPLISANLNFKTNTVPLGPPSPITNIMADGREPSLFTQAIDATLGHAQALVPPTQAQLDEIVAFETNIFSAQLYDDKVGLLDAAGATGGPIIFSTHGNDAPGFGGAAFDEFNAWETVTGMSAAQRQAIARGQKLFHGQGGADGTRGTFTVSNVAGFNDAINAPAVPGSCATCHNFQHAGSDIFAAAQRDIGTGGHGVAIGGPALAKDLPIFKVTCPPGSFLWDPNLTTVLTNDPAKALITGRCRDIGSKTVPSLRGLASHEPFFIDGSAATLLDLVNVYNARFSIGFTEAEKRDLVAFLNAL